MKNNKQVIILALFAAVLAVVSWFGYDLVFKKEKEAPATKTPGEIIKITPKITIPPEVPAEMREKLLEGTPLKKLEAKITAAGFIPATLTLSVGDRVTWTNDDQADHQLQDSGDLWGSKVIKPGGSYTQVFDVSGTYEYFCKLHPSLKGKVIVEK